MKLNGKCLVITGGANGMGRELVLESLKRGARVAAVDLQREALDVLAADANAGERLSIHVANITDRDRVSALVEEVVAHHGAVDGLLNNAGIIQPFVPVNELGFDAIDRVLDVNLHGTINMTKAFLPHLLERPEAHLLNVSSMGGFLPVPGQSVYGASKAAVKLLTEGLYVELLDTSVGVSVVMPGAIGTNIMANSGLAQEPAASEGSSHKVTPPDKAARIMLDGIEADRLHIFAGSDSRFLNLAVRIAPKRAMLFIRKMINKMRG